MLSNADLLLRVLLLTSGVMFAVRWALKRRRRHLDVSDDAGYRDSLIRLSESSARHSFDAYSDIDWDSSEFAVSRGDARWVLSETDPLGRHRWYRAQPLERQIAIGMWRQANMAKVGVHFEGILIRGLLHYVAWVPNGSPEYRYCLHEAIEECNHTLMFQEMVNRIGIDVPGMPRWLRRLSPVVPLCAGPMPSSFFFGVLAGEVPFDHMQTNVLREDRPLPPIVRSVIAVHVAEEARHISFAHEYLRRRVPNLLWFSRFLLSLYVPVIMRLLGRAMVVPPRGFFRQFEVPRSVRREVFFSGAASRQALRVMFADIRLLCHELGLMNPVARLMWRLCRIGGRPSRYRGEPQRAHLREHTADLAPHG